MTSFFINFDSITAFNTLTRAAKYIETKKPEAAVQFYKKAADLYKMEGGRIREAADVLGRVFVLFFILFFVPNARFRISLKFCVGGVSPSASRAIS